MPDETIPQIIARLERNARRGRKPDTYSDRNGPWQGYLITADGRLARILDSLGKLHHAAHEPLPTGLVDRIASALLQDVGALVNDAMNRATPEPGS